MAWAQMLAPGGGAASADRRLTAAEQNVLGCNPAALNAGVNVSPGTLAQQASSTLQLPTPVAHRSPPETNSDHGTAYTWVNLWTWWWADATVWHPLSARAAAGPVWAQVTATPTHLIIDPGDGSAPVVCPGPGRAWRDSDGDGPPPPEACAYRYAHVSATLVTATVTIEWTITWVGSGNTGGTMPSMLTQSTSRFIVEQIQVVTR